MKLKIEIDEATLRSMVHEYLIDQLGTVEINESDIHIQVKSKQNYRSEWEEAVFRAVVDK